MVYGLCPSRLHYIVLLASGTTMDDTYYGTASLVEARVSPLANPPPTLQPRLCSTSLHRRGVRCVWEPLGIPADAAWREWILGNCFSKCSWYLIRFTWKVPWFLKNFHVYTASGICIGNSWWVGMAGMVWTGGWRGCLELGHKQRNYL